MKYFSLYALLGSVAALTMKLKTKSSVNKVLDLLNDMQTTLATETEDAEKANAKFECWCNKVDALEEEINAAQTEIEHATAQIEQFTAAGAAAEAESEATKDDIAKNQDDLAQMQTVRDKEAAEFQENKINYTDSIAALGNALTILEKHQSFAEVKSALRGVSINNDKITALLQQSPGSVTDEYQSQSGGVFGILQQMETEFKQNLADAEAEEANAVAAYAELKSAKEEQLKTLEESLETSLQTAADAADTVNRNERIKEGKQQLLAANAQAMNQGKESCAQEAEVFAQESQDRADEAKALGEAIRILSSDDMFAAKTAANSFLQNGMRLVSRRRLNAIKTLRAAETPKAFFLSTKVGNDAMETIFAAGKEMVASLKDTMQADTDAKDGCVASINESAIRIQENEQKIEGIKADKEALESKIKFAQDENKKTTGEMEDMITQLNDKADARTEENAVYKQTIVDQNTFKKEIGKAKKVLEGFYSFAQQNARTSSLVQQTQDPSVGLEAMPETKRYEKKDGGSILSIFDDIVSDADKEIALAEQAEATTQASYEDWVTGANGAITGFKNMISELQFNEAEATSEKVEVEKNLDSATDAQKEFVNADTDRKETCEFIMTNYDARQEKQQAEIDAINDALSQLQGAPSL